MDLTTHLEQHSLRSQIKVTRGSLGRYIFSMPKLQERFRMIKFWKIKLQDDKDSGRERFRKIMLLQRKVKLSDLTTHLEQLSLRS
jgi:hypothetical protein